MDYISEKEFKDIDFTDGKVGIAEYEYCSFDGCTLSNINLENIRFSHCSFTACDLSNTTLFKTSFQTVEFKECKLLGLHFEECNSFGLKFSFYSCKMDHSSFYGMQIKPTIFKDCSLIGVDLIETNLSGSTFLDCNFQDARFERTNIEKSDFRGSIHYEIDPRVNSVKGATFSKEGLEGLLRSFEIVVED